MSHCYNGNEELLERPSGQSFNPRIARITELSLKGGLTSELAIAAVILGVSKAHVHIQDKQTVHDEDLRKASAVGQAMVQEAGSILNQAMVLDGIRRAHLLPVDSRNLLLLAAEQTLSCAVQSPLLPILIKAISRYKRV